MQHVAFVCPFPIAPEPVHGSGAKPLGDGAPAQMMPMYYVAVPQMWPQVRSWHTPTAVSHTHCQVQNSGIRTHSPASLPQPLPPVLISEVEKHSGDHPPSSASSLSSISTILTDAVPPPLAPCTLVPRVKQEEERERPYIATTETRPEPIHIKNGRYQCRVCPRTFKFSKHARRHMMKHTGQKPYQCAMCAKRFVRQDTCQRHMKIQCCRREGRWSLDESAEEPRFNISKSSEVPSTPKKSEDTDDASDKLKEEPKSRIPPPVAPLAHLKQA